MVSGHAGLVKGRFDVRFGSEADICSAQGHVRFTPNSDRKSRHAANGHVRIHRSKQSIRSIRRRG
jgi:hypothetical protein